MLLDFKLFEAAIKVDIKFVYSIMKDVYDYLKDNLTDLSEDDVIHLLNDKFKKYKIQFVRQKLEINLKQYSLGIIGGITMLNGSIAIIISDKFIFNFDKKYRDRLYKKFVKTLSMVIEHEMIHREQFERMDKKVLMDMAKNSHTNSMKALQEKGPFEYFSNKNEIMTFANQTVNEFKMRRFNKEDILNFINNPEKELGSDYDKWQTQANYKKYSQSFIAYYLLFRNTEPEIWNRYLKYITQYL